MTTKVCLEYKRVGTTTTSTGRITSDENGLVTEKGTFEGVTFRKMMTQLASVLMCWPIDQEVEIVIQRTDRAGLLPYTLDKETVQLLRTDVIAGLAALESPTQSSPSTVEQRVREQRAPQVMPTIRAGVATLADAFGDRLYTRVRGHELECPGCGFWVAYAPAEFLADPGEGKAFTVPFTCTKRCKTSFVVSCSRDWASVRVDYLLNDTTLNAFYFPRAWNEGRPWVSREALTKRYEEYLVEKETAR